MAGRHFCLLAVCAVSFFQPVLCFNEDLTDDMFNYGHTFLAQKDSISERGDMPAHERNTRTALTETVVNNIFREVFNDIQAGLPNVSTIITTYSSQRTEAERGCRVYTLTSLKQLACDLVTLMRQLSILSGFKELKKVTHVRSLLEFKDYSLGKYLTQIKLSKEFRGVTSSITFDTNIMMTVSQEQGAQIGTYFKELADFDQEIAHQDTLFLQGRIATIKKGSADLWEDTEGSIRKIMKAAVGVASVQVAEATANLILEIAQCFNPFKVILGGCNPNTIMDRLAELAEAIRTLARAVRLLDGLNALSNSMSKLRDNFNQNGDQIALMNNITETFSTLSEEEKLQKAKDYLDAYNNYSPKVTAQDLVAMAAKLEYVTETGCDLIRSAETVTVAGLVVNQLVSEDCNTISSKVAQLGSYYNDWFVFQFELIDSFSKRIRGHVAMVFGQRLTIMNTQIKIHETVLGLTMEEVKLQTAATGVCNVLEYKAGGTRPSVCRKGIFTSNDINQLIAYTSSVPVSKVKMFPYIPTVKPTTGNSPHISVTELLRGNVVRFQLPLNDTAWMQRYNWLSSNIQPTTAYFIERMDLYVPGLKCTDGSSVSMSVEITNDKNIAFFPESAPPQYIIGVSEMKFQSEENSPYCQPCAQVDFPIKTNTEPNSIHSTTRVCVKSNGIVHMLQNTLLPSMYSVWNIRLRQESCTLEKDNSLGYDPMITVSVTRVDVPTNIDECFPNPCEDGETCTDQQLSYQCQ